MVLRVVENGVLVLMQACLLLALVLGSPLPVVGYVLLAVVHACLMLVLFLVSLHQVVKLGAACVGVVAVVWALALAIAAW